MKTFIPETFLLESEKARARHKYFRRLLGNDVGKGLLSRDMNLLGSRVREICFENARGYFGLELGPAYEAKK